uniref:Uncharacterized protein n=1 Tax=Eutreptiella gymnastica TaxID=73025 RepID=A0A7S1NU29_9EUGL
MHNPGDASQTQILFAKHQCIHSQFCNWRSLWACHDGPTPEGPGEACKILEQGNGLGRIIDGHLICPAQVDPAHLLLLPPYAPIHLEVSVLFFISASASWILVPAADAQQERWRHLVKCFWRILVYLFVWI